MGWAAVRSRCGKGVSRNARQYLGRSAEGNPRTDLPGGVFGRGQGLEFASRIFQSTIFESTIFQLTFRPQAAIFLFHSSKGCDGRRRSVPHVARCRLAIVPLKQADAWEYSFRGKCATWESAVGG